MHARDRQIAALGTEHSTDVDAFKLASLTQREQFYSNVLRDLLESDLPFMIGGGYAVNLYTHARCPTKDLDIFTTAAEFPRLLSHLQRNNRVSADESWLGKVHRGRDQARFTTDHRREIYLTRSIHAYEVVLAMSDDDDIHTSDAKFSIGLAFFLHAEIAEKETAISDLEKALEYYEAALPGYQIDGRKDHLKKLESARTETKTRLKKLQTSQEASDTQSPSPS